MDLLDLLLIGLVGLATLLCLLAPLLVRLVFRHDAAPAMEPRDPAAVPDVAARFLDPRVAELESLGFVDCGRASCDATRGGTLWLAIVRNDHDENMACVSLATLTGPGGSERLHMGQVEFVTMWSDGREVLTSNLAQRIAIDPLPEHDLLQVPDEHDLARLLRIHEARVRRRGLGPATNPAPGRELEGVERMFHRLLAYQEERGWFWRHDSDTGNEYRLTLRGAWRMTTCQVFPYAQLAKFKIAREANDALLALGLPRP